MDCETGATGASCDTPTSLTRRRILKGAGAATVGAVIWTEPTIKGLAQRPAYASTSSAPLTATSSADATLPASDQVLDIIVASDGFSFVNLVFTDLGDGRFTVTPEAQSAGCTCVADGINVSNITARNAAGTVIQTTGAIVGGVLEFDQGPVELVINVNWSGLTITCT